MIKPKKIKHIKINNNEYFIDKMKAVTIKKYINSYEKRWNLSTNKFSKEKVVLSDLY